MAFDPTSPYFTYKDAEDELYIVQGSSIYDRFGNTWTTPPRSKKNGWSAPNPYLVSGGGKISSPSRAVNVHELTLAEPLKTLDLPSPYYPAVSSTKEHAYGTPICFPLGFNGYKYWMAAAPYPTQGGTVLAANKYENPTIYVSNDPDTGWISPPGVQSSPLFTSIGLSDTNSYYADPYLFAAPDSSKLYIVFCWFGQSGTIKSSLMLTESVDGLNWTTPVAIATSASTTFTPNTPSIIWNGSGWTMMSIDTRDGTGTFTVLTSRTSSALPYAGWAAPGAVFSGFWTAVTVSNPVNAGRQFWHAHFVGGQDGQIVGLAADNNSSGGTAFSLQSADGGLTFSAQPFSAYNTATAGGSWYRPSLCVCYDGINQSFLMFASRIGPAQAGSAGGFYMQKARLKEGRAQDAITAASISDMVTRNLAAPASLGTGSGLLMWDSFNRADSPSTPGNADSGQVWNVRSGTWGILSNQLYISAAANSLITQDLKSQTYNYEVTISVLGGSYYLLFRVVDSSNFWRFGWTGGAVNVQCIQAGSIVASKSWNPNLTITAGDRLGIIASQGGKFTMMWNRMPIDSITDTLFATGTSVGLQTDSTTTRFDQAIARVA